MIPEMPPQRNAKPGFAPSSIIERAAQHLDWTVAFGMRHNTLRGLEETTSQQPRPDPPHIARASRLRSSRAGGRRLLLTSRLSLASVVVAAAAAGTGIFLLAHSAGEKAAAKDALATEARAEASTALLNWLYFSRGSAEHRAGRSCRRRTTLLLRNTGEGRYLWLG